MSAEHLSEDLVLCRAAGWLDAPEGESRTSTVALITRLVAEVKRLRVVFEEACNEVKMSHGTPCFCKYCHEETPK